MVMRLTYKYRIYPSRAQRQNLSQTLEACRWLFNKVLETRKSAWEQDRIRVSQYATVNLIPQWKAGKPELTKVHSQVLQEVCKRVDLAFSAFFRRVKRGEKPGYPRFRGFGRYDSFTFPQSGFRLLDNGKLRLSKIGDVKIKLHRPLIGKCKTLTVCCDHVGNWYACFSCDIEPTPLEPSHRIVGIDLGLSTFAYFSDGTKIDRMRWAKQDEKDIARLQRKKDHSPKDSPERNKIVHALCHAYKRAANRRKNFAHQESRQLVNKYQFIVFEDLSIQKMRVTGNKIIRRGITDVAWDQFVQFTLYKAENAGRTVILVDPKGTTQICSQCGEVVPKGLSVRIHNCPTCGLVIDRDYNAALNILARGLSCISTNLSVAIKAHALYSWEQSRPV